MSYNIYFISGHRDVTDGEWEGFYRYSIDNILASEKNPMFVVGDYKGVDERAQDYLKEKNASCVIFHMFNDSRYNAGFHTVGGFKTDEERDAAMTKVSNIDLAFVRLGKRNSGTVRNLQRRKELTHKKSTLFDLIRSDWK